MNDFIHEYSTGGILLRFHYYQVQDTDFHPSLLEY